MHGPRFSQPFLAAAEVRLSGPYKKDVPMKVKCHRR
jgi:hypothetical protein